MVYCLYVGVGWHSGFFFGACLLVEFVTLFVYLSVIKVSNVARTRRGSAVHISGFKTRPCACRGYIAYLRRTVDRYGQDNTHILSFRGKHCSV